MKWNEIINFVRKAIEEQRSNGEFTIDIALKGRKERAFVQGGFRDGITLLEISPALLDGPISKDLKRMSLQSLGWEVPNEKISNFHKFINSKGLDPDEITKKFYEAFVFGLKLTEEEVYF